MWLTCQRKACRRARWRAISLRPGTIGATLVALFGFDICLAILKQIRPGAEKLAEEDAWALPLTRAGDACVYLQFEITKLEYERGARDWKRALEVVRLTSSGGDDDTSNSGDTANGSTDRP